MTAITETGNVAIFRKSATFELIDTYSKERLRHIADEELGTFLADSQMKDELAGTLGEPKCGAHLYRVVYHSAVPELDNLPTIASGLIAIPDTGDTSMPLVSYQHGTVFDHMAVPSHPDRSDETRMVLAQFAGQGYIVIGADYFGRGVSELPDSYLVKGSTHQANFDFLVTALGFIRTQNIDVSDFFLSGWSQGGWVTMQYLRLLEARGVKVRAAAVASAPVDVYLTMNRWMSNRQAVDADYLPGAVTLQLLAQEYYCRQPGLAEAAIRPEYLAAARALYNGEIDWATFRERTPKEVSNFVNADFRESGFIGNSPYWHVMQENQAYRWRAVTPTQTYFGGSDEVTPTYIGHLMEGTQKLLGGADSVSIDAGDKANHRDIFIYGLSHQKTWFDGLMSEKKR